MNQSLPYTPEIKEIIMKTLLNGDNQGGGIFSKIRNKVLQDKETSVKQEKSEEDLVSFKKIKIENVSSFDAAFEDEESQAKGSVSDGTFNKGFLKEDLIIAGNLRGLRRSTESSSSSEAEAEAISEESETSGGSQVISSKEKTGEATGCEELTFSEVPEEFSSLEEGVIKPSGLPYSFSAPDDASSQESCNEDQVDPVDAFIKRFKNDISRSSGADESSTDEEARFTHKKIYIKNLCYLICNVRGFTSKKISLVNILMSSDIDIIIITETHMYLDNYPEINGYKVIYRNRNKVNSKGGIAIAVKDELAQHTVKLCEGKDLNEFLLIKLQCFEPELVCGVYYGNQEATAKAGVINQHLVELFSAMHEQKERGFDVLVGGDFNVHVGLGVKGNEPTVSKGGELLIELCKDLGFEIANNRMDGNTHTHFDVSSKTSRVLDLVITNKGNDHVELKVDTEKEMTPYTIKLNKGIYTRNYTDHLSIIGELKVVHSKSREKIRTWRLSKPGGKAEYQRITNELAIEAVELIIYSENCAIMAEKISALIQKAKMLAFGMRTLTHKRFERETDERLQMKRIKDLQEAKENLDRMGKRLNEQVFLTRKKVCREEEGVVEALNHYKTGERLEDADEIFESVLEYNKEVLSKNECKDDISRVKRELKIAAVEEMEKVEDEWSEESITWEDYRKVVAKVHEVNKTCYRDFTWAGAEWQAAMYMFFKRIYDEEDIPESFLQTKLKKLYKRKGSKTSMASYRFIHLKEWASKMMEKLAMEKCNDVIKRAMPDMQIGGTEECQVEEHISALMTMARIQCRNNGGLIIQLVDCQKCFDKILLSDTLYAAGEAGLRGKRMRVMHKLHENTEISIIGDKSGRSATITNSTGQGTNWAPASCSLAMGTAIKNEADKFHDTKIMLGDLRIDPLMYVDDVERMTTTAQGAREGGEIFTKALNELGLEAHPGKSAQIIMGSKKYRDNIRKDLENEPVMIQGFKLIESEEETYLGIQLSAKGPRDSVTKSIRKRIQAAIVKEVQLSKILEDEMLDKVGWIEAVKTLFNSIIISTLSYGSKSYVFMTKGQIAELESAHKDILYRMLKISKYAHYAAVLMELNMIRFYHIINQLKIGYVNTIMTVKKRGYCYEIWKREEMLYPGTGAIAEVKQLCEMYNLGDATEVFLEKEHIKERIVHFGRTEIWKETLTNSRIPYNDNHMRSVKTYMRLPKYESRLYFAFKIGELQFKDYRKGEFKRRFGNTTCFADGCSGPDNLDHVRQCSGYESNFYKTDQEYNDWSRKEFISYLKKIDAERAKKYYLPVLFRNTLAEDAKK